MFTIIRTIGSVTRAIQTKSNRQFKAIGLDNNLFIYVIRVCERPGLFLGELADLLSIDRTTSFRAVKKLAQLGYLELKNDPDNQKIKRVYPAPLALELYPQLNAYEREQLEQLISDLTPVEKIQLEQLMRKLRY